MVISEPRAVSSFPASPWKNGGGSTCTLAIEPPDAALDNFQWRISLAEVNSPGEFSPFPGIDRTILLWSGDGLILTASDWSVTLERPLQPFSFSGDDKIDCDLIAGPTMDLNVMARRGAIDAAVQVAHEAVTLTHPAKVMIVLCAIGAVQVLEGGLLRHLIGADEFVRIESSRPGTILVPSPGGATFVLISFFPPKTQAGTKKHDLAQE